MLSLDVSYCWPIHRLDVTNVFLDGNLNEHVYCEQPSDFVHPARPDHVCFLRKVLCGLKQAPWVWFHGFAAHLRSLGFHESKSDTSLFVYHRDSATTYLLLHVDDIILTASSSKLLRTIIDALGVEFDMSDFGSLHYFLGISVTRSFSGMFLSEENYAA